MDDCDESQTTTDAVTNSGPGPGQRVMVFIDGQNLFKGLSRRHKARVHPLLLARELAGDRKLVGTSYYSGIHDPNENASMFELVDRRHRLMERTGVVVNERTLGYMWQWRIDDRLPPAWKEQAGKLTAKVKRRRVAREKGVDVALALDAVAAALTDACDVVVIVSRDRDLAEVAAEINGRCQTSSVVVEVAYVSEERGDEAPILGYEGMHHIDAEMVSVARDEFDYHKPLDPTEVHEFLTVIGVV